MIIKGEYFKNPLRINEITIDEKGITIHSLDEKDGCGRLFYKKEKHEGRCKFTLNELDCRFLSTLVEADICVKDEVIYVKTFDMSSRIANLKRSVHIIDLKKARRIDVKVSELLKLKKFCDSNADQKFKGVYVYDDCLFATNNKVIAHLRKETASGTRINIPIEIFKFIKGEYDVLTDDRLVYFKREVDDEMEIVYSNLITSYSTYADISKFTPKVNIVVDRKKMLEELHSIALFTTNMIIEKVNDVIHLRVLEEDHKIDYLLPVRDSDATNLYTGWNVQSTIKVLEAVQSESVNIGINDRVMILNDEDYTYVSTQIQTRKRVVE